ncbi:unnamed protein product [Adineta steineri]|uniref:Uncharacterized protein n=1 Tax=Adineta steineri TaxID=433720 RepID=A0A819ELQ1_9BILA|nr:unnamed protein product [Adineta steineri]CAF3851527.1 unnamed protein product [Adineta steineri]
MDNDENQEHLLSSSITEETPLTDNQLNEEEEEIIYETYDWTTSLISQICREGDLHRLRLFIEYSRQMSTLAEYAAQIADRLDTDTGLSPLHHAARYQQLHVCTMLLSNMNFKFGVNIKDINGQTPMHSAFRSPNSMLNIENQVLIETDFGDQIQDAQTWQEEYTTKILPSIHPLIYLFAKANGDINARDKYLQTPLHYAVARHNLSGVKLLITLNANIEAGDRQGIRPLHLACKEGSLSIVEYLMEQNAEIDAMDADEWIPVHHACIKGHLEIIKLIHLKQKLKFQELLEMKTNTDATCLHLAVQSGNIELVEYILTEYTDNDLKYFINEQTEPMGTALHIAAKFCDRSMLKLLYGFGADPTILNSHDQSSLHIASVSNRLDIIEELYNLTKSSLLEIKDNHGQTALSVTTHPDIIDRLIAFGADISSLDNNHMNAIMIAVSNGHIPIVDRLLCSINDQSLSILDQVENRNDRSIFLIAIQTGSIDMCSLLLTHPYIQWDTTDKQRMNAIHIAAQNNSYDLIEFLYNYIRKSNKFLSLKSRSYSTATTIDSDTINIQTTTSSSSLRLYIDAQNEDGKTPLHLAAEQGHASCIQMLLNYGANVLLVNYLGQLPLHSAIQNGHSQCADLLIKNSITYMTEFHSVLLRRQSPLITACQNGFVDIVQLLISQNIGVDFDIEKEENPLEIAIKYRQIETIHVLLEHPLTEYWLMAIRNSHQTPLRDMIRYIPDCAKHALDKLILKTNRIDFFGETFERTTYNYKYIDDYFLDNNRLYTKSSRQLYRNHPLIIALDREHHSILEHPLIQQLMARKWKLYRLWFYLPRILSFLLLFILTCYVLIVPAPVINSSSLQIPTKSILYSIITSSAIRWIILTLSKINILKIFIEIILYRGFHVPFAQLFGLITFISTLAAFIPLKNHMTNEQWQIKSFAILFQWFNIAVILRSVPFFGQFLVMLESILIKFVLLLISIFPLLIAFTMSIKMIFFNQPAFVTLTKTLHKSSSMIVGEFDYETLFFSKATFTAASFIFVPFIVIMTIVFINLLLGITVGDIQSSIDNARAKANAYWIRDLIYIESTLPSKTWLKSNIIEQEIVDHYPKESIQNKIDEHKDDEDELLINHPYAVELRKLLDILHMLCTQANQFLEYEINLEKTLKRLLTTKETQASNFDQFLTVQ